MLTSYLATLGLLPVFTSRAVLPVFAATLIARFDLDPGWAETLSLEVAPSFPPWATSDGALIGLGAVSLWELVAERVPELRGVAGASHPAAKALAALFVTYALVAHGGHAPSPELLYEDLSSGTFDSMWALGVGLAVWFFTSMRRSTFAVLEDLDPEDDLRLRGLLNWAEDGLGFIGVFFVLIMPVVSCLVAGLGLLALFVLNRILEARDQRQKYPCDACQQPVHRAALACGACGTPSASPSQIGFLGFANDSPVKDPDAHRHALRTRRRCARCACRLDSRSLQQDCAHCGLPAFSDEAAKGAYLGRLHGTLPRVVVVSALLGSIPVLGIVPGIIYYRVALIAPLRAYVPAGHGLLLRWGTRVLNLLLLSLQWVPVFGIFALPAMCCTNYFVYRSALMRQSWLPATSRSEPAASVH